MKKISESFVMKILEKMVGGGLYTGKTYLNPCGGSDDGVQLYDYILRLLIFSTLINRILCTQFVANQELISQYEITLTMAQLYNTVYDKLDLDLFITTCLSNQSETLVPDQSEIEFFLPLCLTSQRPHNFVGHILDGF